MGFGIAFGSGVAGGAVGIQDYERQRELKRDEVRWGLAAKLADQHITSWNSAYQEAQLEARKANQIKGALFDSGIHPAVIDHFYELHGDKIADKDMQEQMKYTDPVEIQGLQKGGQSSSPTRGMKHYVPPAESLSSPLQQLGYKQSQVDQMIAPYQSMAQPQVNQMNTSGKQYQFNTPTADIMKAAEDARSRVAMGFDRINNAKEAQRMFEGFMPAGTTPEQWAKFMPQYGKIDEHTWGNIDQKNKIADEARKSQAVRDSAKLMGQDPVAAQAILAGPGGMPISDATQMQPNATPQGQPQPGFSDPNKNYHITANQASPTAAVTQMTPSGPQSVGNISLEGSGPTSDQLKVAKNAISTTTRALTELDMGAAGLAQIPEATGIVGSLVDAVGGLVGQVPKVGPRLEQELIDRGIDKNKITTARTHMRLMVDKLGAAIENDKDNRYSQADRRHVSDTLRGLSPTSDLSQTLTAYATIRSMLVRDLYHNISLAEPAPADLATNENAQRQRIQTLMRYGMPKTAAFEAVGFEKSRASFTSAPAPAQGTP